MNIFKIFESVALEQGNKIAIVSGTTCISYRQLLEKVNQSARILSDVFLSLGVRRFGLVTQNELDDVLILLAAAKNEFEIILINPNLKLREIENLLLETGTEKLIVQENLYPEFNDYIEIARIGQKVILDSRRKFTAEPENGLNLIYLVTASSGSTGAPKPIAFSQMSKFLRMEQSKDLYSISENDTILNASAIHHSLGQRLTFLPLLNGARLVLMKNFSPKRWIQTVMAQEVTFTIAVSTHLHGLAAFLVSKEVRETMLSRIVSSSASISREVKRALYQSSTFKFYEQYGASEVATVSNCTYEDYQKDNQSVGKICKGVQVLIDSSTKTQATHGEILVKSPLRFLGYMKNGKLEGFDDSSWFRTGDFGEMRSHFLHFRGRIKDSINCGGQNLFPNDIENYLMENENVTECCVVGTYDQYFGQVPIAFVVLSGENGFGIRELNSWALRKIPRFQIPHKYIVVDSIPKLSSGKVDKENLRHRLLDVSKGHE